MLAVFLEGTLTNVNTKHQDHNLFSAIHSHLEAQGSSHVCSGPAVIVSLVQQGCRQSQGGRRVRGHSGVTLMRLAEENTQRVHLS